MPQERTATGAAARLQGPPVVAGDWRRSLRLLVLGNDRDSNELRARHVRAVRTTMPWVLSANLLQVLLCGVVLWPLGDHGPLGAWVAVLSLLNVFGLARWWSWRQRPLLEARPGMVRRTAGLALVIALCWVALPLHWFARVPPEVQLLLGLLLSGLLTTGAIALAMVPPAALVHVAVVGGGTLLAFGLAGQSLALALQFMTAVYMAVLSAAVLAVNHLFWQRYESERSASRHSEVVGLLLRDFEETTDDVLWEVDHKGRLVQVSTRLAQLFERSQEELAGKVLLDFLTGVQLAGAQGVERLRLALDRGEAFRDMVLRVSQGQGTRWWSLTAKPLFDVKGSPVGWRGVVSDVTAERRSNQHLAYMAHFDSLTGLANRVNVRNRLSQAVEAAVQGHARRSVLMCMDLDNFKGINDSMGHSVGDAVLQEMAKRLRAHMRKSDLCGRLGGDEFAVVLDDVRDTAEAAALAERLVGAMRVPIEAQGMSVLSGVSIGMAFIPEHACTVDDALVAADLALYAAKAAGRGRVHVFTEELGASQRRRLDLERELREALVRNELQVLYQPQVDVQTWQVTGAEALLRWHHPQLGTVSPVEFVGVAEETGLIHNIGAWVLDRALSDAKHLLPGLRIAVNASTTQVQRPGFVQELQQLIRRHGLPPERLELEITESVLMENMDTALQNLHGIKSLGLRIALDDFGTGYSSLAYLRVFPFDKLKIDRAFIQELMATGDARAIVRTMIDLAGVLGMETLAEGVEEPAQLEALRQAGCTTLQGFLIAKPLTARELVAFVQRWPEQPRPAWVDSARIAG